MQDAIRAGQFRRYRERFWTAYRPTDEPRRQTHQRRRVAERGAAN